MYREEEILIKSIVDYYFGGRGGIDNARDTYTNSMQFFPGQNRGMEWRKKASRGKITSRTGSRRARFLVYSRLNYSTRKGISSETKRFL